MGNILKPGQWSHDYPRCLNCGTTEIEHKADGLCNRCYLWFWRAAHRFGYVTRRLKGGILRRTKRTGKTKRKSSTPKRVGRKYSK